MPISTGDQIAVSDSGRAEIGLADGNILHVGGRTTARFESLYAQQGENDQFSSIKLEEGSLILSAIGSNQDQIPRIDTQEATIYLSPGSRVRVNEDPRRGTVVIVRAGSVELRTREGSSTVRSGQYAMIREGEEPEIERGSFSRDRLDLWAADRMENLYETRSASAQYVEPDYQSDVQALDGYGDWSYDDTYGANVWVPRVGADWTPYSYGSWYYTPAGLTWWSFDPWGWFPFHFGNWFFDVSFNHWCWSPAYVYSPAWVYWGFTPSFVGWCPIGFFNPFFNGFGGINIINRTNVFVSINNVFSTRTVDFRGWNFAGASSFGTTVGRMQVIPGSRIGSRLGATQVAITSRPIVVPARSGAARQAIQSFVRQAPQVIQRTATGDPARLAPLLARQRTLPASTVSAIRENAVAIERGRLAGPGVRDVAPRGALVDRRAPAIQEGQRSPMPVERGRPGTETGRSAIEGRSNVPSRQVAPRGLASERPDARVIAPAPRPAPAPRADDWRSRSRTEAVPPARENPRSERSIAPAPRAERAPSSDWRSRPAPQQRAPEAAPAPRSEAPRSEAPRADSWRSRSDVPPARRVIDGAVPGRRAERPPAADWRSRELPSRQARPQYAPPARPDRYAAPRGDRYAPAPRSERYAAPPRENRYVAPPRPERYAPAPRSERPAYVAPPPRAERAPSYSAPPRAERAPAYSAPAPRAEHHAPPPSHGSPDRSRRN